jgi:RNA polymerase sigma-70 factor (ECF subfamily)
MALPLLALVFGPPTNADNGDHRSVPHLAVVTYAQRDDDALVERICKGEREALQRLYEAYYASLVQFGYHLSGEREVAEDAVQQVFLSFWSARSRVVIRGTVIAYLYRAVRNTLLKGFTHDHVVRATMSAVDQDSPFGMGVPPRPADVAVEMSDDLRLAVTVIRALPERQRTAVLLRWHGELTTEAIAEVMSISRQAVEKLLRLALGKLRIALEAQAGR